jgi:protein-S-isoprenylcysteine O-methyltransferase Ste14
VPLHTILVWVQLALAPITFAVLMWMTAPYGRHDTGTGWGPRLPARWGWILMEVPSVLGFAVFFFMGDHALEPVPLLLFGLWQLHYVHRTFIYPFRIRSGGKPMPLVIALSGAAFNCMNSFINAYWIGHLGDYPLSWLRTPMLIIGVVIFVGGFVLNIHSDSVLLNLRKPGETGYKIPMKGGWKLVSAPNYLGEQLEWIGWTVATWSLAGLAFALYTAANLMPRAIANHRWYVEKFPDYPPERKRLIPWVW